jgi:hypothetical protein
MKLAFRPAVREDRAFIIPTWSASYKKSRYAGLITSEDWADVMHRQLGKILDRAGARAIVAYDRQDPDYFYGWRSRIAALGSRAGCLPRSASTRRDTLCTCAVRSTTHKS